MKLYKQIQLFKTIAVFHGDRFDKAKLGAIQGRKAIGSHVDSQLPNLSGVITMFKLIGMYAVVFFIFILSFTLFLHHEQNHPYQHDMNLHGYYIEAASSSYEPGQNLVPKGSMLTTGDIDEITYYYQVLVMPEDSIDIALSQTTLNTNAGIIDDDYGFVVMESQIIDIQTHETGTYTVLHIEVIVHIEPSDHHEAPNLSTINSIDFDIELFNKTYLE